MKDKRGIVPRKIKGFRDIDPNLNRIKWKIVEAASEIYKLHGFEHWDTPAIEYADNLGKYMPDSDTIEEGVYSFRNPEKEPVLKSDGKELRDEWDRVIMDNHFLSMRYDLTAPLARHYAESIWVDSQKGNLSTKNAPLFRRYQFGPVYRYEAKLAPGRFREFWQLDFDSVGTGNIAVDAEVCMILSDAMEAIGLKRNTYVVNVNNRKILQGFLRSVGIFELRLVIDKDYTEDGEEVDVILEGEELEQAILRIIDKMDKIGIEGIIEELGVGRTDSSGAKIIGLGLPEKIIKEITRYLTTFETITTRAEILDKFTALSITDELFVEGLEELNKINELLDKLGYGDDRITFSPTLVRGMAYYTGPIFEVESKQTYIDAKGNERRVGSICGGGRYDDLVENLVGIKVPATGASIGVDRLAELLLLTEQVETEISGPVFIANFDDGLMPEYQKIAEELRASDIETEIYYGSQKRLGKQLAYADKKNSPLAIIIGGNEIEKGVATVKDLKLGKEETTIQDRDEWRKKVQAEVPREGLVRYIKNKL